jgi:hypothetical protein
MLTPLLRMDGADDDDLTGTEGSIHFDHVTVQLVANKL